MQLASLLDARDISLERRVLTKQQVYNDLVDRICHNHHLPICGNELLELILRRDETSPTTYASGIAIPHIRMEGFEDTVVAMTFLHNPIDCNGHKISWVVLIITNKSSSNLYLNLVSALLKLSKDESAMLALGSAHDGHSVIHQLEKLDVKIKKEIYISDVMIPNPPSIGPDATLRELNFLMSQKQVAGLPVIDKNNYFLGEVNILDVLKVGVPEYMMMLDNLNFLISFEPLETLFDHQDDIKVKSIMVSDGVILRPNASIIEAVFEMINNRKRYMSVVQDGKLVGVVTAMEILRKVIIS